MQIKHHFRHQVDWTEVANASFATMGLAGTKPAPTSSKATGNRISDILPKQMAGLWCSPVDALMARHVGHTGLSQMATLTHAGSSSDNRARASVTGRVSSKRGAKQVRRQREAMDYLWVEISSKVPLTHILRTEKDMYGAMKALFQK